MDIQDLDKTIAYLYEKRGRKFPADNILDNVFRSNKDINIDAILRYLAEQKYIIMEETPQSSSPHAYYISYQGIVFYETASLTGRPFKSLHKKEIYKKWYNTLKTIVIALNAGVLLYFAYRQSKPNDLEKYHEEIKTLNKTLQKQAQSLEEINKTLQRFPNLDTLKR